MSLAENALRDAIREKTGDHTVELSIHCVLADAIPTFVVLLIAEEHCA